MDGFISACGFARLMATDGRRRIKRPIMLFIVTEDWYFLSHRIPMARAAQEAGFEVHVACRIGTEGHRIQDAGFTVHPLKCLRRGAIRPTQDVKAVWELAALKRRVRPDVCHYVAIKPITLGLTSNLLVRSPSICTFAGLGSAFSGRDAPSRLARVLTSMIRVGSTRGTVHAVVQNPDDAVAVEQRFHFPPDRVHLIEGSGIDARGYSAGRPFREGPVRFVYAGRLLGDKGLRELLTAFGQVSRSHPDAELVIVGDPDHTNPSCLSEEEIESARRQPGVVLLGHIPQAKVKGVLLTADVAVLPSYGEGLPKFLLEAGASGLALVATDVPGCRSVVDDGLTGLLIPPRDPEALARAMLSLAEDRGPIRRLGQQAQQRVQERFDVSVIEGQIRELYSIFLSEVEG